MFSKENLLNNIIYSIVIIVVSIILIFIFRAILNRPFRKRKTHNKRAITMTKLLNSIIQYAIIILGLLGILSVWGVDIKPFLAGAGILGLAIGFGAQDLVKDIVSGFFIILDNYYDVGDIIEVKDFKGEVIEIGLRSTRIVDWKGNLKIYANREITEVINYSKFSSTAIVYFKVRYTENLEVVYSLIEKALSDLDSEFPQVVSTPQIHGITALEDNGVVIRIVAKTQPETHYAVERGMNKRIKEIFKEHNIPIAIHQVLLRQEEGKKDD